MKKNDVNMMARDLACNEGLIHSCNLSGVIINWSQILIVMKKSHLNAFEEDLGC